MMKKIEDLNTKELIYVLSRLLKKKQYKKTKPYPKFSEKEVEFLVELIFHKPPGLVFFHMVDYAMAHNFKDVPYFNGPWLRKMKFFLNYIKSLGNAAHAARASGYSVKCAKQQGYRIVKEIRESCREP